MALEAAYYIDPTFFSGFVRGKIFLHVEMPWQNFSGDPIYADLIFDGAEKRLGVVFSVF